MNWKLAVAFLLIRLTDSVQLFQADLTRSTANIFIFAYSTNSARADPRPKFSKVASLSVKSWDLSFRCVINAVGHVAFSKRDYTFLAPALK